MSSTSKTGLPNRLASDAARIAALLERNGWQEDVAGYEDFNRAVRAVVAAETAGKGLLIMGAVGVGKTALADVLFKCSRGPKAKINCSDSSSVDMLVPQSDANLNGGTYSSGVDDMIANAVVYLDDIGAETIVRAYGNEFDRVGCFIVHHHARGRRRLLATTNLNGEQLQAKYGARVFDRLVDKCVILKFAGRSKRGREVVN